MRSQRIKTFYSDSQVLARTAYSNYSKSPLKPKLLLEYLDRVGLIEHLLITDEFEPYSDSDFEMAHESSYVNDFFNGQGKCSSNGLNWSKQFAKSVRYTNASLHAAIRNSIVNPRDISFSPTSGFHHAKPSTGLGFCTFSGQVIASLKILEEFGLSGAYLDLDGHFGNSIEDSRSFCKDLDLAVPPGFNINPTGKDSDYLADLARWLERLKSAIISDKIHYVVWCHGADSHADDDLGSQCTTDYWVACSTLFWTWVKEIDSLLGRPLPVTCSLFGGYREDDYTSVLSLHTADLVECLNKLIGLNVKYKLEVKPNSKFLKYNEFDARKRSRKRME